MYFIRPEYTTYNVKSGLGGLDISVLRHELIPCGMCQGSSVLGSPSGGLKLLIPEAVLLGSASEDEYNPTLDDKSIGGGVRALPEDILIRPMGLRQTSAGSCDLEVVEIRSVHRPLLPCLSLA